MAHFSRPLTEIRFIMLVPAFVDACGYEFEKIASSVRWSSCATQHLLSPPAITCSLAAGCVLCRRRSSRRISSIVRPVVWVARYVVAHSTCRNPCRLACSVAQRCLLLPAVNATAYVIPLRFCCTNVSLTTSEVHSRVTLEEAAVGDSMSVLKRRECICVR